MECNVYQVRSLRGVATARVCVYLQDQKWTTSYTFKRGYLCHLEIQTSNHRDSHKLCEFKL